MLEKAVQRVAEDQLAIGEALISEGPLDAKHLIIDAYQHLFHNAGWEAIAAAGLSNICTLLTERSQLALPRLLTEDFVADAAFVDGSHIFHNVFVDLYFLRELVRPGGLIILDDCQWPSVATAVRYFEVNTGWQSQPIGKLTRLRAFRLPDPRVEPSAASGNVCRSTNGTCVARSTRVEEDGFAGGPIVGCAGGPLP